MKGRLPLRIFEDTVIKCKVEHYCNC